MRCKPLLFRSLLLPSPVTNGQGVHLCIDLRDPASQTLKVSVSWIPEHRQQRWQLPVWTPGSYTVRDPSQHLHSLALTQAGEQRSVRRVSPSKWIADVEPFSPVQLTYQLEARQLTVRTNWLDPQFASLCLSAVAMLVEGQRWSPHTLELVLPTGWQGHVPLPKRDDFYFSSDFDQLVDSPVHAGGFEAIPFVVAGCDHSLVLIGTPPMGWPKTLVEDIEAVCNAAVALMAGPPPAGDCYQLVIQLLDRGYGGLEHDHAQVLQFAWPALAKPGGYHQLLQLVGHEYLHQWNVRRLRPKDYVPYDHGAAVVSDCLWFAEGITSYFDLCLTLLAGRSDRQTLLQDLGNDLSHVLLNPGRSVQSLADSSREAWVRLYKATPAGAQTQISYYKLGTALAFCLDVQLRAVDASLGHVLRDLWRQFGVTGRGYGRSDIQQAISHYSPSLAAMLPTWLDDVDSLPIADCVEALGLMLTPIKADSGWTGLTLTETSSGVEIKQVQSNSPGHRARLIPGDEVVGVRGVRITSLEQWPLLLKGEEQLAILFARRGRLEETQLIREPNATQSMTLEWNPHASAQAKALRDRWFEIL